MEQVLTEEELDRIEARASKATPGPWAWESTSLVSNRFHLGTFDPPQEGKVAGYRERPEVVGIIAASDDSGRLEDAEFIAYARNDIPKLVREVRRLKALLSAQQR